MLGITPEAVSAIRQLTHRSGIEEDAGLRIASTASNNGQPTFVIELATVPRPTDQVLEVDGVLLFLDVAASDELDGKLIDAVIEGDQVRFQVAGDVD